LSVQSILERFARTELWNLGCLDFNRIAGPWITAGARSAFAHRKSAKTHQRHGASFFQGGFHSANRGFQCARGGSFGNVSMFGNVLDQFSLVHKEPLVDKKLIWLSLKNISRDTVVMVSAGAACAGFLLLPIRAMDF
jgi:hypothetical protein